jgi:FkbM family methyltransferase
VFPYALLNEKKNVSLHLTKSPVCSSLFKPNIEFLKNYPNVERFDVEKVVMIEATTLDILNNEKILGQIDFIKIDVQGAELDILKGGEKYLIDNIIGIEVEVEFQSIYENQPLFADVDTYIRKNLKLELQDLRKAYWKYTEGIDSGANKGQIIFGDALYFRSPKNLLEWCSKFGKEEAIKKIHMACFMGVSYGYMDYSLCILNQPDITNYFSHEIVKEWKSLINDYQKSLRYTGKGSGRLFTLGNLLSHFVYPMHGKWASGENHLGSRKKFGIST